MSFLGRALSAPRIETKVLDASALLYQNLFGGPAVKSGVAVNVDSALRTSTVFACMRVLAEGVAQLPLKLYQESDDGAKTLARRHPLYTKLWRKPNDFQTSFEWRETMMMHAVLTHGGFSIISRNSIGEVLEFLPVLPAQVKVIQGSDYSVQYEVYDKAGKITTLPKSSMLHLKGPSWNGFSGLETVTLGREAIGLAIATEESQARLHSNGVRPSGILSTDAKLGPEQYDRIKKTSQEGYSALQNAFKLMVLDGGWKFSQIALSPADAQTHESRKHQIEEVCRFMRVFPQMIGYGDKTSTYASAEQFFMAHVTHSLMPWIERFEQVLAVQLLSDKELDQGYFPKFNVGALLRGDAASRAAYYASGIVNGWLVRNEARRLEDLDPLPGLDDPLVPLNMGAKGKDDPAQAPIDQKALARGIAEELGAPHLEEKIGRVLSLRNEKKLKEARDLIAEVLAQVDAQKAA